MKILLKTICSVALVSIASATMLFALPQKKHARNWNGKPNGTSGGSITLDQNFNTPFFANPELPSRTILLPDGKYVMFFNVDTLANQSTGALVRFNADGSLDTTFSFSSAYAQVTAVAPWFDLPPERIRGKTSGALIVAAQRVVYGVSDPIPHTICEVLRLNDDGSIDPTFGPAASTDGGEIRVLKTFEGDPTILVGGRFTAFNGQPTQGIVRLLSNGSVDPNFGPVTMTCPSAVTNCGVWTEPVRYFDENDNEKILIAGDFSGVDGIGALCVAQLNSDGTLDTSFAASGYVPNGFFAGSPRPIRGIVLQSDGKIVIGGRFNGGNCNNHIPLVRLNTDGSRDQAYGYFDCLPPNGIFQVRGLILDADDNAIATGYSVWRFSSTDGSLDPTFHNPDLSLHQQSCAQTGVCPEAYNISMADNETNVFVGGLFTDVDDAGGPPNGQRWGAAKFSTTNGALDTSFTTSHEMATKVEPSDFLRLSDNSTLIGFNRRSLTSGDPAISHNFGRLLSGGSLDGAFDPISSFSPAGSAGTSFICLGFTSLSDDSFLLGGINGQGTNYAHLLANDTEDTNYQADSSVWTVATALEQGDGKIAFSTFNFNISNINEYNYDYNVQDALTGGEARRLDSDGSLDSSFQLDPTIISDTQDRDQNGNLTNVYVGSQVLDLLTDDKVLFGYLSRDGTYHLVRLNSNGTIDPSFTGTTFPVTLSSYRQGAYDPQNGYNFVEVGLVYATDLPVKQVKNVLDGKLVLLGSFTSYAGDTAHGMARIKSDGTFDPTFSVGLGAQWIQTQETAYSHPGVDNLEVGLDSKLLVTGSFEAFNGTVAPGIINLNPDGSIDSSFVPPVKRQKFDYQPAYLKRQPDGSFLISGPYSRLSDNSSPSFFHLLLPPGIATPPGDNVTVGAGPVGGAAGVDVTFNGVNTSGSTTVAPIDPNWAGNLPPGYQVGGTNLAFEIYTTATYTPPIVICFDLSSLSDSAFAAARVLHNAGDGLVDVTASKDAATKTICATVNSLSPFLIANPTAEVTKVVSRKVHNATPYDVTLVSSDSTDGIECRGGGPFGEHQVIVNFGLPITYTSATVTAGSIDSTSTTGNAVTVNLTGVPRATVATITFHDASAGGNATDVVLPLRFLEGDTNGDGSVNSADISQVKSQSGHAVTTSNFREDVNADGYLSSADIAEVKSRSGTSLPANVKATNSLGRKSSRVSAPAKRPGPVQVSSKSSGSAPKSSFRADRLQP